MKVRGFQTVGLRILIPSCLLALTSCGDSSGSDSTRAPDEGCRQDVSSIKESTQFLAYEDWIHAPGEPIKAVPINESVLAKEGLPNSIDGLRASAMFSEQTVVSFYYSNEDLVGQDPELAVDAGSLTVKVDRLEKPGTPIAEILIEVLGDDRVSQVAIGGFSGGLVYSDPDVRGVRVHNLEWGDESATWTLVGVRKPEEMVGIARTIACN
jgi:hypothetical protein